MKKNMYQLLNEVKIDFGEYEDLKLSAVEKQAHQRRILREVRNMKNCGGRGSGMRRYGNGNRRNKPNFSRKYV